jgi:hypothetical protein
VEQVLNESVETQAILQRMSEVRCDLDEDVQEIVEGARVMGKWRYYVRTYPWVFLGAALAAGYLIVPRRQSAIRPDPQTPPELANHIPFVGAAQVSPTGNTRGMLLGFVGNLVLRGLTSYAMQQADKLFATQTSTPQRDDQP